MDILIYIFCFLFGYFVALILFLWQVRKSFKRLYSDEQVTKMLSQIEEVKLKIPLMFTQTVDKSILLYDMSENFVTQGSTLEEIVENLNRFKKIDLAIIVHGEDKFYYTNGKLGRYES